MIKIIDNIRLLSDNKDDINEILNNNEIIIINTIGIILILNNFCVK